MNECRICNCFHYYSFISFVSADVCRSNHFNSSLFTLIFLELGGNVPKDDERCSKRLIWLESAANHRCHSVFQNDHSADLTTSTEIFVIQIFQPSSCRLSNLSKASSLLISYFFIPNNNRPYTIVLEISWWFLRNWHVARCTCPKSLHNHLSPNDSITILREWLPRVSEWMDGSKNGQMNKIASLPNFAKLPIVNTIK